MVVADGTPTDLFSQVSLLEENNLDVPEICKVFSILGCCECGCDAPPLTLPGAAQVLDGMIDKNGGTVWLGRADGTDKKVAALVRRFCL
ncbi:hypothetical protein [Methanogenium organophilum]|uniref:Uncharacterized protein n=1 Tax=Methanogenium organophilum TaxID=2199 RepID=A0A9X9S4T2_METOG|nr:hypothetical protein [Methanogenium organophilum]WAI01727.1 hypothetical protein OU421_02315 [Methanogenium organophilum]